MERQLHIPHGVGGDRKRVSTVILIGISGLVLPACDMNLPFSAPAPTCANSSVHYLSSIDKQHRYLPSKLYSMSDINCPGKVDLLCNFSLVL